MKIIRKILPALFILLFVLASSSCGKSDVRPSTTAAEKRVAATQQAEASETPQSSEEVNSFDCYKETIESYGQKRVDSMASLGYNIGMPEYDYAVRDVNGDSVDELVIFEVMEEMDSGNGMIGAIYTLDGDQPVELYFKGRHGSYTITADGYFVYHYHNLTLEKLVGAELVEVAQSTRITGDNDSEIEAFFRANGVSTAEMVFDYTPYVNAG